MIRKAHGSVTVEKELEDGSKICATAWGRCNYEHEPRSDVSPGDESTEVLEIEEAEIEVTLDRPRASYRSSLCSTWLSVNLYFPLTDEKQIAEYLKGWGIDIYDQSWELDPDQGPDGPDPDDARDAILERDYEP